ncbi:MAG: ComF family protein [Eubacteriales bacterium]
MGIERIKHEAARWAQRTVNLLCPPVCAFCGKETSGRSELCVECAAKYLKERQTKCPHCGKPAVLCVCGCDFSRVTRTFLGGKSHVTLTFYTVSASSYDNERITEQMIFLLKDKGQFAQFFADELADEIERLFAAVGQPPEEWILTYPPRSTENFMKSGLDQSEEVTRRLAKRLGSPWKQTFVKISGSEQKTLCAEDRMVNASRTLVPRKSAIEPGGKYLLFDDIITSGATMMAAARHLYFCGAAAVFPISIARSLHVEP